MIIDAYCHLSSSQVHERLKGQVQDLSDVPPVASERYLRFYDANARIKYMDRNRIDIEILTADPMANIDRRTIPRNNLLKITKLTNDFIVEAAEKHPSRLVAIAGLPTLDGEFLDELERCITSLGMKGCLVYSNVLGKPIDSPEFVPFWEKMQRYDLPVEIHPAGWEYYEWIKEYFIDGLLGWPFDSSIAMARIVFGKILQRLPNLKIVVHHMGGMIPFFSERIAGASQQGLDSDFLKSLGRPLTEYFKMFYGDTIVGGSKIALKCGIEFFGPDHVVFATDFPNGPGFGDYWTSVTLKNIREAELSDEDREKILSENARHLFKI